jgi:hypothetical protein
LTTPVLRHQYVCSLPVDLVMLQDLRKQGPNALPNYLDASDVAPHRRYTASEVRLFANLVDALEAADINLTITLAPHADDEYLAKRSIVEAAENTLTDPIGDPVAGWEKQQIDAYANIFDYEKQVAIARRNVLLAADQALLIKATTGSFPDALQGHYADPFSNQPLQFKKVGGGFLIHTMAPDEVGNYLPDDYEVLTFYNYDYKWITFAYPGPKPIPEYDGAWPPPLGR